MVRKVNHLMDVWMPIFAYGGGGVVDGIKDDVVQLMPLEVVVLFSVIFIIVGFARGVRAEAWVTAFILIAFLVLRILGDTLIAWSNRIYKLMRFALAGGIIAENPVEIWEQFADNPPLIETDAEQMMFRIAVLLALYFLGLIVGRIAVRRELVPIGFQLVRRLPDLGERLMGGILGAVNGFLIALFVLPRVLSERKETVIIVPETGSVTNFMDENVANVAFVVLIIIILLGLMASGGARQGG